MINIQLKRSGGILGKSLKASGDFDMDEPSVLKQVSGSAPVNDPAVRDGFTYQISINQGDFLSFDPSQIKGPLKKILSGLEDDLKAV